MKFLLALAMAAALVCSAAAQNATPKAGKGKKAKAAKAQPKLPSIVKKAAVIANAPDPAEIARVAALLSEKPVAFGRPISDRATWDPQAATRDGHTAIHEGERLLRTPMKPWSDDVYLIYSRTGSRTESDNLNKVRRNRIFALTEAECLENKGRFTPELEREIRSLCAEPTWVGTAHDGTRLSNFHKTLVTVDLYSSALIWNLAQADFLLGDKLSPEIRALIRKEAKWRIFDPIHLMVEGKQSLYWLVQRHNWNAVCLAGVTGAALELIDSRQERAFFVAVAEKFSLYFLSGFTADGYCGEGIGYWNYGFGHYILLSEIVRLATNNQIDMLARPEAIAPAAFGARFEVVGGIYPAFADTAIGSRPMPNIYNFINERFGMGLKPLPIPDARFGRGMLFEDMMYLFPVPGAKPVSDGGKPVQIGLRSWFDAARVLICRPAAGSACRIAMAVIGNDNGVNHNHNDVGSFIAVIGGAVLVADPGGEIYTARTFGPHRYDSNVLNSFGHSVPLVAGKMQDAGPQAQAVTLKTAFSDTQDTLAFDIKSAYSVPALKTLQRTYVYSREGAGSLSVSDEVAFDSPQSFETALLTFGTWKQTGPATLEIADEGETAQVNIDTGGLDFELSAVQIHEHLHTQKIPTRIAIRLKQPVKQAIVTVKINPK